ncbi:hypothetical protein [Herbaspirillum sp. alder98]|nr:hypothetical protein [Herbaspirillum sp. alder98]MCA1323210.1 hypothetical protein [Herbaspirillum sp. alder98]
MQYFAMLYRKLVDYLNEGDLSTGSHQGQPHSCSWYSGLSQSTDQHRS